jgi:hypothetical protein
VAEKRDVREVATRNLIEQVHEVRPDLDVRGGFRATKGTSPNLLTLLAAIPMLPIVAVAVVSGQWLLIPAAVAVLFLGIVLLFNKVNSVRVVAETPDELVVFTKRQGKLDEIARLPRTLTREHYWESQWMKVKLGGETLWVSRRPFEPTVDRLDGVPG